MKGDQVVILHLEMGTRGAIILKPESRTAEEHLGVGNILGTKFKKNTI